MRNSDRETKREMFQQAIPVLEYFKLMRDNDFDVEPEVFIERLKSIGAHVTDENKKDFKYVLDIREELDHIDKWIYEYRYEYLHERLEKLWKEIHELQRLLEKQQSEFDLKKKLESEINKKISQMIKDVNKTQQNDSIDEIHFWYENTFPLILKQKKENIKIEKKRIKTLEKAIEQKINFHKKIMEELETNYKDYDKD